MDEWLLEPPSILVLWFMFFSYCLFQDESAEAAAILAWDTGLEAPGPTWSPEIQLV